MQNLIGKNREQSDRAAQKHREKVERDRRQDHFLAKHELRARGEAPPRALLCAFQKLLRARNWQDEQEKRK